MVVCVHVLALRHTGNLSTLRLLWPHSNLVCYILNKIKNHIRSGSRMLLVADMEFCCKN